VDPRRMPGGFQVGIKQGFGKEAAIIYKKAQPYDCACMYYGFLVFI